MIDKLCSALLPLLMSWRTRDRLFLTGGGGGLFPVDRWRRYGQCGWQAAICYRTALSPTISTAVANSLVLARLPKASFHTGD